MGKNTSIRPKKKSYKKSVTEKTITVNGFAAQDFPTDTMVTWSIYYDNVQKEKESVGELERLGAFLEGKGITQDDLNISDIIPYTNHPYMKKDGIGGVSPVNTAYSLHGEISSNNNKVIVSNHQENRALLSYRIVTIQITDTNKKGLQDIREYVLKNFHTEPSIKEVGNTIETDCDQIQKIRKGAIENAFKNAEQVASLLGGVVGEILSYSEDTFDNTLYYQELLRQLDTSKKNDQPRSTISVKITYQLILL